MSAAELGFSLSVFLACAVEAVEALTIVMAVGQTRSWPSALAGAGAAGVLLAILILTLGAAITAVPIDGLRVAIGLLLLVLGVQWLRKAILRAAGLKALHDERGEYAEQSAAALAQPRAVGDWDRYSFVVAGQGVLVEGLEVALIVVTFGANRGRVGQAAVAAAAAVLAVIVAGVVVRAPLARVPENAMKFVVGVMLCSFGIFWTGEGAGVSWPGGDAMLPLIAALVLAAAASAVALLRRGAPA